MSEARYDLFVVFAGKSFPVDLNDADGLTRKDVDEVMTEFKNIDCNLKFESNGNIVLIPNTHHVMYEAVKRL